MIKALLIDDEPAANRTLRTMVKRGHPEFRVLGEGRSVTDGLAKIQTFHPDLIFLDINLPDGSGFDLIKKLPVGKRPEVIFVTSEENYALQAIKVAALGYLIKPVNASELAETIELAKVRIRQKNIEQRFQALKNNLEQDTSATKQIGIPSEHGVEFVAAGEILYCSGVEGYTKIQLTNAENRLSSYSIGEYRKMLSPYGFFIVHRSYLVNRQHVVGWFNSTHLKLSNGEKIAVSRRRKREVDAWLKGD